MRQLIALIILGLSITLNVGAQSYKFDFTSGKKTKDGYIKITSADRYANAKGYGYDLSPSPDGKNHAPFFFQLPYRTGIITSQLSSAVNAVQERQHSEENHAASFTKM